MLKKGFTLIELLVVIAILAILATVIVVIINPGELLKQARDTTRISDLAALNSAIALYLSDVNGAILNGGSATTTCTVSGLIASCGFTSSTAVDGTGWVKAGFSQISSGSPLARLPIDPTNSGSYGYAFKSNATGTLYELDARMESNKYASSSASVVANTYDGGNDNTFYEVGSLLSL